MQRASFDGIELEYEIQGSGEPVVLIHPGHFADWFKPLMAEPALAGRYQLLWYHRVGCAGSSPLTGPLSLAEQGAHCRALLQHLGITQAHLVGHSSSGNIALQMALDAPETVQSLAVLEPALYSKGGSAQRSRAFVETALQLYHAGDKAGALDTFLAGLCGSGYREVLDRVLPGAFAQHVTDADTFFQVEMPAMRQWSFERQDAQRIRQPVLAAVGAISQTLSPVWMERQALLLSWLPNVEPFVLPDATHLMQVQNPRGMAQGLADFLGRHPLPHGSARA
jgi:pimeloyl-ACP methyl ester carboxylesterase